MIQHRSVSGGRLAQGIAAAEEQPFCTQDQQQEGCDPGPDFAQHSWHGESSRVEGRTIVYGQPGSRSQERLPGIEQVDSKGSAAHLVMDVLGHRVYARLIRVIKGCHRERWSHGNSLLARPGDCYTIGSWPWLDGDGRIRRDLPIARNWRW